MDQARPPHARRSSAAATPRPRRVRKRLDLATAKGTTGRFSRTTAAGAPETKALAHTCQTPAGSRDGADAVAACLQWWSPTWSSGRSEDSGLSAVLGDPGAYPHLLRTGEQLPGREN